MPADSDLQELAEFFSEHREEITRRWVEAVRTDPAITTSTRLPHEQLMDHLPLVFEDFADTLRQRPAPRERSAEHAQAHGEHRWWQGFEFGELVRETRILRRIISVEYLSTYAEQHPQFTGERRQHAETVVHTFFDRLLTESAKQFVDKTEEERAHYRALFESTAGAYLVLKPDDYTIVSISDAYLAVTFTTREQLSGHRLFDIFPELPLSRVEGGMDTLLASLERVKAELCADAIAVHSYPMELPEAEGGGTEERYWSTINSPVFAPGGELAFIMHRVEDVTPFVRAQQEEGREAEGFELLEGRSAHLEAEIVRRTQELLRTNQQLRQSQERVKLAVTIAQMGTFEIDLRTDAVVVNEQARAMYGWSAGEPLTFSRVQAQFYPEDRAQVMAAVSVALDPAEDLDEFDVEQRIVRTDGVVRWIRVRARAFFEGTGAKRRPTQCMGTFLDITERKEHESALLESEARFRQLADSIPQLAWMARPDGWLFWYNQRWYEFTGTTPEQMEGWGWQRVHDEKELPRIIESWTAALASAEPWEDTFPLRRHDGEFRVHLSRAMPFRDSAGKVVLWFGTNTDITELVQAEEAANAANRAKDHFIAVLSHELRTPLTPVLASIMDLHAREDLPPPVSEAVELIRRNVELEARLIDDLLDVTRITKGKLRMDRQVVSLHSVLKDALRICATDVSRKHIAATLELGAANPHVEGDGPRLLQAFWNLLQNAVKFTPAEGEITIRTRGEGERVTVEIEDNGIGIEAMALPRIFDAFGQADDSISRRFGGLGLGLALSKALVEAHGGTIEVSSRGRDQGTVFTIELETTSATPEASGIAPAPTAAPPNPLRILLVEDHDDTRRTLHRLIERWGHNVADAATVQQALQLAVEKKFDLLVSDLGLPDGHGNDLMRELRASSGMVGIAVSGFGTEDDKARSREAGFHAHLSKPIGTQKLKGVIEELAATLPQGLN
ncbi:hypothetical protein BH20VER2_BH20VER2_10000 [soil metagenome]